MSNDHVESDIALLLMQLEEHPEAASTIYQQIHDIFEEMRADGDEIPVEFLELERELDVKFAA